MAANAIWLNAQRSKVRIERFIQLASELRIPARAYAARSLTFAAMLRFARAKLSQIKDRKTDERELSPSFRQRDTGDLRKVHGDCAAMFHFSPESALTVPVFFQFLVQIG